MTFRKLVVDETTTALVPCGRSVPDDQNAPRHELPFHLFQRHSDHTKAFVARVQIDSGSVLLVPSMELVRFYFGSSGALLANMFSGALGERHLYESAEKDPATGEVTLQLAAGLPGIAAATVARIAFNKTARRQMRPSSTRE